VAAVEERREIDTPVTVVVGLVGAILVFVLVVALQALFQRVERDELERKVVAAPAQELESLRADQLETLSEYRYVDRAKGIVAIPIDRAMELEVRGRGFISH
jgi:hypothetical protein